MATPLVEVAHLSVEAPPPVGQVVRQISDVKQRVLKVPLVEKRLVEVASVVVECVAVNLWSVEEPDIKRFESEVRPPVAVTVPVKFAAEEIVWPLIKPDVIAPVVRAPEEVMLPVLKVVEKRLVEEAVVANEVVEVAFVVVALPVTKRLPAT